MNWLALQQGDDGRWGAGAAQVKLTCLATLVYFFHGELPSSEEYGIHVEKGLIALIRITEDKKKVLSQVRCFGQF